MIKSDLLDKVYLAFQNLDGWQDSVLELNVLDGYNGNLHLVASLDLETKNSSSYVKIDIEIFDETLNECLTSILISQAYPLSYYPILYMLPLA